MQNKEMYNDKDEEVDLAGLFKKGWDVFKMRLNLFLAFIIAGILFAIAYYNLVPPTYKSRMIISSSIFQGPSFMVILDNLKQLIEENNDKEIASLLGIDPALAKKIEKIEVYPSKNYAEMEFGEKVTFKDEKVLEMYDKREEFVIVAYVKDNSVFKILEKGIIHYLNNNPALKENSFMKQKTLGEMKNNIHKERIELDSLKNSLSMILTKKSSANDIFIGSPGSMYTDMINIYLAEIRAHEALVASKINVIESFRLFKKQYSPKLGNAILSFTLLFFFLFIATVIILSVNKKEDAA